MDDVRVILVGGTSHAGKSSVALVLSARSGWTSESTDRLGRHPGRPWRDAGEVPPHVREHFLTLDDAALLDSVITHYRNMFPAIETLVRKHADSAQEPRLVLEGSGIWPDTIAPLLSPQIAGIWLTIPDALLTERMFRESLHAERDAEGQRLIERFRDRAIAFNRAMMERVRALNLSWLEVSAAMTAKEVAEACLARVRASS
jgi:2-phosphoglycerate kinase